LIFFYFLSSDNSELMSRERRNKRMNTELLKGGEKKDE